MLVATKVFLAAVGAVVIAGAGKAVITSEPDVITIDRYCADPSGINLMVYERDLFHADAKHLREVSARLGCKQTPVEVSDIVYHDSVFVRDGKVKVFSAVRTDTGTVVYFVKS